MKRFALILALTLSGCGLFVPQKTDVVVIQTYSDVVAATKEEAKNLSQKDRETLYKVYKGASLMVKNATPDTTIVVWGHIDKVCQLYGWTVDTNSSWSKTQARLLEKYKNEGLDFTIPQQLNSKVKDILITHFNSVAEGCL